MDYDCPTGTIAISCDCSHGMEPLFALCYDKRISDSNEVWKFVNPEFERRFSKELWYEAAIREIADNHGSCQGCKSVPVSVQNVFVTAHDINWQDRLMMQASLQQWISSGISSTVNLPSGSTPDQVYEIYVRAWELGLKGVTVYVDGAKKDQPIVFGGDFNKVIQTVKPVPFPSVVDPPAKTSSPSFRCQSSPVETRGKSCQGPKSLTVLQDATGWAAGSSISRITFLAMFRLRYSPMMAEALKALNTDTGREDAEAA